MRLRGIGYLLPSHPLSDSLGIVEQVDHLRGKAWAKDFAFELAPYPTLMAYLTALLPDPAAVAPGARLSLSDHLSLASEPWRQIRIVSAVLSVLIVPATWLLARRFLRRGAALVAAAFVATSLLHVGFAAQEKPHGPVSAFLALAVVAGIALRQSGGVGAYLVAGAAIGVATATMHSGIAALLVLPTAVLLRERREGRASALWTLAALAIVAAFVRFGYPSVFLPGAQAFRLFGSEGGRTLEIPGGNEVGFRQFRGGGFAVFAEGLWSHDPALFAAAALGLLGIAISLARGRVGLDSSARKDLAVALSLGLPYLAVFGMCNHNQDRYLLPMLPFFACLGAFGVDRALEGLLPRGGGGAWARAACGALLPALAVLPAWRLGSARAAPDTFARAAAFLQHAARPEEDRILIPSALDLPLLHGEASLRRNAEYPQRSNWVRYQMRLAPEDFRSPRYEILIAPGPVAETAAALRTDPIGYFRANGARWVVLPVAPYSEGVRRALQSSAELALRVTPEVEDPGVGTNLTYVNTHKDYSWRAPFFRAVLGARCTGQTLEVYRLEPGGGATIDSPR